MQICFVSFGFASQTEGHEGRGCRLPAPMGEDRRGRSRQLVGPGRCSGPGPGSLPEGLRVGFNTAAAPVHALIQARDEKRLLRMHAR